MPMGDRIDDLPEQPPPEPRTGEEARAILDQIRFEHGIHNEAEEAELGKTAAWYQRQTKVAERNTKRRLGSAMKAISTDLYSSRFRFIYELVQNADDTAYSSIQTHDVPYIKFTVRSGEVIIDSNEDGFTVADVLAICDVAQSSKQENQDTTGEKGLGFKSVFAISRLARIQSGFWSFEFRYPANDGGMGMIAPHWIDSKPLDDNSIGTRITLAMARTDDDFCQDLKAAFQDIPVTTLLFLRKIKKLIISFEREDIYGPSHSFMRENEWNESTRSISVETVGVKTIFPYRMWSDNFLVFPKNSSDNPHVTANHSSRVQLAFPVDASTNQPRMSLDGQHAFNFLPMKRMAQLPFIIQADFDMAASREAAIDTPRNRALRNAACKLFADAVAHFCEDARDLRYTWTQYLPGDQLNDFWKPLRSLIKDNLSGKHLLESRKSILWPISGLRIVPSVFQHQGEPLFDKEIFLSDKYDEDAVTALKWLGLLALSNREMLECVKTDLTPSARMFGSPGTAKSIIKSTELSDSWHTTFLEFLLHSICPDQQLKNELRKLTVLPLSSVSGTTWATPETALPAGVASRIYLPRIDTDDGSPIIDPEIGLRILHHDACVEPARREFYAHWGISHVDPKLLIEKVTARNKSGTSKRLSHYVGHFSILFWHGATPVVTGFDTLYAADTRPNPFNPKRLYLRSDEEYSTDNLLQGTIDHPDFGFLNNGYFNFNMVKGSVTRHINCKGQTWERWLMDIAGVRTYPELKSPGYDGVSPVFQEILKRAPAMVVGTLKAHWNEYKAWVTGTSKILEDLKNALVQCRTGETQKLSQTILPTEATLTASRSFGVEEKMHFLCINAEPGSGNEADWAFLQLFDVCMKPSLSFSLQALDHLTRLPVCGEQTKAHVIAVYESIGSIATFEDKDQLQDFFSDRSAIYFSHQWRDLDECVWEGPSGFSIPKSVLAREYKNRPRVQNLFMSLLDIGDATHEDTLEAIEAEKLSISSTGILAKMYKELDASVDWNAIGAEIRTAFEAKKLIFDGREWVSLSSCVWSSAVSLQGRPVLKKLYPTLLGFFVERLEVKSMSTAMMLEELIRLAGKEDPETETMKMMLGEIASMLASDQLSERVEVLLKKLKQIKFLPVTGSTLSEITLVSPKDSFFIVDDRRLGDAFRGKTRLLDFACNDLALMQSLYAAFRLENSYLSRNVRSETTVQDSAVDENLTKDMRKRSFAISCCVLSHKGSQAQKEYETTHKLLLACEVFACAAMYTNLHVVQDKDTVTVPSDMCLLKITEDDGKLKIFVPKDDIQRRRCYRAHLSKQLMGFLNVTTESANKQLYRILNDHPSTLDEILAEEGIPEAEWLDRPNYPDEDSDQASDDLVIVDSASAQFRQNSTSGETTGLEFTPRDAHLTVRTGEAGRIHVPAISLMHNDDDSNFESDFPDPYSPERYRKVLEHVLRRAQAVERTSTDGGTAYDMGAVDEALFPLDVGDLGMLPTQRIHPEVFKRIGAAGELFVFERLLAHGLTAFSRTNWRSKIRNLVYRHLGDTNIEPFTQKEIADIMYDDNEGQLERLIRHESGRHVPEWDQQGGPIQFMLEVKTTINSCSEPFIISQYQHQLMSEHKLVEGRRPRVVYVVARVHDLLTADIGVEFFVDPKSLEGSTLHFDWGKCEVKPQV